MKVKYDFDVLDKYHHEHIRKHEFRNYSMVMSFIHDSVLLVSYYSWTMILIMNDYSS